MPLFSPLIAPMALYMDDISQVVSAAAIIAGSAYLSAVVLQTPVTVTQMRCAFSGSPTGNVDMGIYDASGTNGGPGNLLGHTGTNVAATGAFTKSLTANLSLSPGQYWLAFLDTIADTTFVRVGAATGLLLAMKTSATNLTVLPATIGTVADLGTRVAVMALLQNSFS